MSCQRCLGLLKNSEKGIKKVIVVVHLFSACHTFLFIPHDHQCILVPTFVFRRTIGRPLRATPVSVPNVLTTSFFRAYS